MLLCLATVMHMLCFVARAGSRSVKTNGSKHRSWSSGLRDDQVHRFIVLVWSWRLNKRASVHTAWAKMTLSPTPPKSMIEVRRACRWIPLNQNCYRCYEWSTSGHTIVFYPRPSVLVRHVRPKRVHEHLVRATMSRFESTVLLRNPRGNCFAAMMTCSRLSKSMPPLSRIAVFFKKGSDTLHQHHKPFTATHHDSNLMKQRGL